MLLISLPFLWTKKILLNYIFIGGCLNILLNMILKFVFHCPRPGNDNTSFAAIVKQTTFLQSIENDPFGFPSGHSQSAVYLTTMIYNTFGLKPITICMVVYSAFIMWQRVYSKMHYVYQVVGGAIIGLVIATGVYYSYKHQLVGHIIHKLDDWSRIFLFWQVTRYPK